jgi:hypothetical protein
MNNGFGSTIYFSAQGISTSATTGSVVSFKYKNVADTKEVISGAFNYLGIGIGKRKKVANVEVILTGSGSTINTANIGDVATITSPWTANVSGNWSVTQAESALKDDDAAKQTIELTQWYTDAGTTIP